GEPPTQTRRVPSRSCHPLTGNYTSSTNNTTISNQDITVFQSPHGQLHLFNSQTNAVVVIELMFQSPHGQLHLFNDFYIADYSGALQFQSPYRLLQLYKG